MHLMTEHEFPNTWDVLRKGVALGVAPGMVAGCWDARRPDRFYATSIGHRRLNPTPQQMSVDTVFDLASVSKVMATATLAARLVDRRWIDWSTRVQALLPQFRFKEIELGHLLSHTAGFVDWVPLGKMLESRFAPQPLHEIAISDRQKAMREWVYDLEPDRRPGEKAVYSDISFLLLGFALEEVTQMPLDRAVKSFVWDPMGIRGAHYLRIFANADRGARPEVAATELCSWRQAIIQGQVHDENCWAMGGYGGHAGVFANAHDVLQFAKALLNGFLSRETLHAFWTPVSRPSECTRTLGWDTPSGEEPSASRLFSQRSVGHLGFTGTSLWIDPQARLAVTLLTNRVHPTRENVKIREFRPLFHQALRTDLESVMMIT